MQNLGFTIKSDYYNWTEETIQELKQALIDINKLPDDIEVEDIYYYISHYKFHGKISPEQIKKKIKQLYKEL